ncbi:hypothetical protein [Catenulispora pinisilvae]|uniref:hypothetical protein n=1 Tax=Catenulispora pinisilvae TaxID=2705253 RepID=UPI0018919E31|nr:hypothetical protein [Catenulispora pinisilvae]
MPHQPLTAVLTAAKVTGFHPGPAFYAEWVLIIGAIIGLPFYITRLVRDYRKRQRR